MNIETARFGTIEINESRIFKFAMPILGFEELQNFTIIDTESNNMFRWLQSTENPAIAFPIVSAFSLNLEYSVDLQDDMVEMLKISSAEDVFVMNMAAIPHGNPQDTTINLLAPLIFNTKDMLAGQVILTGSGYESAFPLFKKEN